MTFTFRMVRDAEEQRSSVVPPADRVIFGTKKGSVSASSLEHRYLVVLNLGRSAAQTLARGNGMVAGIGANPPVFPSPTPTLAEVTASAQTVMAAQTIAGTRAKGTASARNTKLSAYRTLLRQLGAHVQNVADANPETAAESIESAGLTYRVVVRSPKPPLAESRTAPAAARRTGGPRCLRPHTRPNLPPTLLLQAR
jgi:hypothetical protein